MEDQFNFIAIDFETANQYPNSACSVGLVRFIDGKETDSVSSLIHPAKMYFVPEWTEKIHHISYCDVTDKPYFPQVWEEIVEPFILQTPKLPFVAHNAGFDFGVIKACCEYFQMKTPKMKYFDSLGISRKVWPCIESHKLTYLGEFLGIDYLAHDALEDARTCGIVINEAAKVMKASNPSELLKKCKLKFGFLS